MNDALHKEDSIITAYRAHGWTFIKGRTIAEVLCELTGNFLSVILVGVKPHQWQDAFFARTI